MVRLTNSVFILSWLSYGKRMDADFQKWTLGSLDGKFGELESWDNGGTAVGLVRNPDHGRPVNPLKIPLKRYSFTY